MTNRGRIELALREIGEGSRVRWCEPGPLGCCCIGCANSRVKSIGLAKADWQDWMANREAAADEGRLVMLEAAPALLAALKAAESLILAYMRRDPMFATTSREVIQANHPEMKQIHAAISSVSGQKAL